MCGFETLSCYDRSSGGHILKRLNLYNRCQSKLLVCKYHTHFFLYVLFLSTFYISAKNKRKYRFIKKILKMSNTKTLGFINYNAEG